jgi:hypothetical protein
MTTPNPEALQRKGTAHPAAKTVQCWTSPTSDIAGGSVVLSGQHTGGARSLRSTVLCCPKMSTWTGGCPRAPLRPAYPLVGSTGRSRRSPAIPAVVERPARSGKPVRVGYPVHDMSSRCQRTAFRRLEKSPKFGQVSESMNPRASPPIPHPALRAQTGRPEQAPLCAEGGCGPSIRTQAGLRR